MNIIVSVKADALIANMTNAPGLVRRALFRTVTSLAISVQRSVKEDKLTGQVLHNRTGTLRRSINREVTEQADGVFAVIGTNVEYAGVHEYGFNGSVQVAAHTRRQRERLTYAEQYHRSGKVMKGKLTGLESMVQAHTRKVNLPERSFLRSTLKEFEPRIRAELQEAVMGVVR